MGCVHTGSLHWYLSNPYIRAQFSKLFSAIPDFLCCPSKGKFLKNGNDLLCITLQVGGTQYTQWVTHITMTKSESPFCAHDISHIVGKDRQGDAIQVQRIIMGLSQDSSALQVLVPTIGHSFKKINS